MLSQSVVRLASARGEAQRLLDQWELPSIAGKSLADCAGKLGLRVVRTPLDGMRAQLLAGPDGGIIALSDQLTTCAARRWMIAHEIGHYVMEHAANPSTALCLADEADRGVARQGRMEDEADCFALSLLMSAEDVRRTCDALPMTLEPALQLAWRCRVPLLAAAMRIIESTYRICAVVVSQDGNIQFASPSFRWIPIFGSGIRVGQPLSPASCAAGLLRGELSGDEARLVPSSAWIDPRVFGELGDVEIQEHSVWSECGKVVTMLSFPHERAVAREAGFELGNTPCARDQRLAAYRGEPVTSSGQADG